jgi:WD40 repeat protein
MAIELDTVLVSDISGQILFQHPVTKNILVAIRDNRIEEIDHLTGKYIRGIKFKNDFGYSLDLSPDGSKILYTGEDGLRLQDYYTQKDTMVFNKKYYFPRFLGNDKILFLYTELNSTLGILNLKNLELQTFPTNGGVTALATSPNGKYIAYATFEEITNTESKAHLYLLDAETMQGLGELGSWDSEWKKIRGIHFSPDSKYLTFEPEYYSSNFPLNIYDIDKRNLVKTIKKENFNFEYGGITLLGNNLYILNGANEFSLPKFKFELHNIEESKLLFSLDEFALGGGIYNKEFNHLYGTSKITMCLNITDIISGIPQVNPFNIKYNNNNLIINSQNKPINNISIMTIEGREVYKQSYEVLVNMNNQIEIPLELSNGSYIINLVSDKETYTEKIIIVE